MRKIILSTLLFATGILHAQSNTENYVQTRVYLEATTVTNNSIKQAQTVQYFDGLGRPTQEIAVKASPTGKDVVSFFEYDALGRQTRNYLPIPQKGTLSGNIYTTHLNNKTDVYGSEKIYSEKILESSPLNRIQQQLLPGNDWDTKSTVFGQDTNIAGEVRKYGISTSWKEGRTDNVIPTIGSYDSGTLYKSTVVDEDGNKAEEFKNQKGQTILVRKNTGAENIDTYYIYNEYGQLVYILPPLAVQTTTLTETLLDNLCYQYRYDRWGRLVEKKIPGKGWEYMVYDKSSRIIMSQDANMRSSGKWLFTKYDKFSRIVYSGVANIGAQFIREQVQGSVDYYITNGKPESESRDVTGFNSVGMDIKYTNAAYPGDYIEKIYSVNYYDTYPQYSFSPAFPQNILGEEVLKDTPKDGMSTKGFQVMSLTKNIEDDNWTKSFIYYDFKGRVIGGHTINHLGGYTKTETALDFAGMTKQSKTYHKRLDSDTQKVITQNFIYDNQNRLLVHKHQVDNNPEEILLQNEYDELSQLKKKKIGGTDINQPLQSIDYSYNVRGWLTKINDPANLNGKLFGYALRYSNPVNPNVSSKKFNGTITEVDWQNASESILKRYNYTYDKAGRLQNAVYSEPSSVTPFNNYYNESLSYDLNGNIKTLKRNAFPVTGTTATQVDDLDYQYTGNRLDKVIENALNNTGYEGGNNTISYDLNGNMINMLDKNIQSIAYNYLDLVNDLLVKQTYPGGQSTTTSIKYLYAADGEKLRKTYEQFPPRGMKISRITDYLDGFQYSYLEDGSCPTCRTESAYEEQAYKAALGPIIPNLPSWKLDFVTTAEGFYSFTENRYIYRYIDHLGNARVSFAKNSVGAPEIIDTNNYYPFGLNHTGGNGINSSKFGGLYSYKYNGKELQETGFFDYGWRQFLPDLGRWNGIDQLAESYHTVSPYAYVMNNPISFIDPDGRAVKPTSGGFEFTGSDLQNALGYLQSGGNARKLINALSTWENEETGGDFWSYFGSWDAWGGSGDAGGNLYASTWGDGAMGATPYDIQEIVFTRTKITNVQSLSDLLKKTALEARKPGYAQMIGGTGDFLGIFDIGAQVISTWKPGNRYLAMGVGLLGAVALKKPGLVTAEIQAEKNLALELAEDMITVRHHTSSSAVNAIKKSGFINVSSPRPFGVDVEVAPFISPSKVRLGQAAGGYRGGGYIEFTVPKWGVTSTPHIGGTGNAGRVIVEGRMQLDIRTLNPKYVKRWWWPF